jgi:hypothetical protein
MTISQYIKRLEHLRELHGDLPVVVECVPFPDKGGEIEYEHSVLSVERCAHGNLIPLHHPAYSEDLEKVVWV